MIEAKTVYFDKPGPENTEATAKLALARAKELGIGHLVVASNTGATAMHFLNADVKLVVVTHHVGFSSPGTDEMPEAARQQLRAAGASVLTTTHLFANVERAATNKFGGIYVGGIISETLRLLGQGTKVCVEIATMALDAGLVPYGQEVIAVGGTGRGADTAIVIKPAHARNFFDTQIMEVICKPRLPRK
ncbi:MAG: pyruvate kinase alpha/beta domain-containing protein [Bacillota bacterium]